MSEQLVSHISDTARWIAAYRAMESARPDALFNDPFAERLAGERGKAIARGLSNPRTNAWPLITRTKLMDDLIMTSLEEGADRILNLAAGLDTRPYRMKLPRSLVWIEADLPAMIDEKSKLLERDIPVCDLHREKVDLSDPAARAAFLDRALEGSQKALVIIEGLLVYLAEDKVRDIAQALHARPQVRWWMTDLASPGVLRLMKRRLRNKASEDAQFVFGPGNGTAFFAPFGWKPREAISMFHAAGRLRRLPLLMRPFALFPSPPADKPGDRPWSAVVRFERA